MDKGLFCVLGKGKLEGITFARDVSYSEAQRIKIILETGGFENVFDIVPSKSKSTTKTNNELIMKKEEAALKMQRDMF